MKRYAMSFLPLVLFAGVTAPAQADSLLGIIGGSDSGALITIGSGEASSSGLVNVGIGGDSLVDAQIGGQTDLANATVGVGRDSLVDANVGVLNNTAKVNATVGGGSLANVGISVGGNRPTPGGGGNNGGVGNGNGNGGMPTFSAANNGNVPAGCDGTSTREVERLIKGTQINGSWNRASNVQVRRVDLCPEMRSWLAAAMTSTGLGPSLHSAVRNDGLLSASLDRSSYSTDRVFAVQHRGNQLTVFVY